MTPRSFYSEHRKRYQATYGFEWHHRDMWGPEQDSEVCEMAMRSAMECKILKATQPDEIEMIANANLIITHMLTQPNNIMSRRNYNELSEMR